MKQGKKFVLSINELAKTVLHFLDDRERLGGHIENIKLNLSETVSGKNVLFVEFDHTPSPERVVPAPVSEKT